VLLQGTGVPERDSALAKESFASQSLIMENNWAAEHLQVIRTLMERSALYRRALAPIMLVTGALGTAAAVLAKFLSADTARAFSLYWIGVAIVTLSFGLILVRRQALRDAEPFWSLATRRVASGLFPCFLTGLALAIVAVSHPEIIPVWLLACLWILNYGCALRAAGFFMERGIKLFGGAFLVAGLILLVGGPSCPWLQAPGASMGHFLMGTFFGLLHLAYGGYLYFTERRSKS